MALIAMAVYSTVENGKDEYLAKTLKSLSETVDFSQHRLFLSINAYTPVTEIILEQYREIIAYKIFNDTNLGTAEAVNKAWKYRHAGENAIKMDDDVVIHHNNWIYLMEEAIRRDELLGQVGLKRRDLIENVKHNDPFYRSTLRQLPHTPGQIWITVEEVSHVMGTCVMHSSKLLDRIGYLQQPDLYGFDDSFMSHRSRLAGFKNAFLVGVDIEHIDRGDTGFQKWKEQHASQNWQKYREMLAGYQTGKLNIYYDPESKVNSNRN